MTWPQSQTAVFAVSEPSNCCILIGKGKNNGGKYDLFHTRGGGGLRSHSLGAFTVAQKAFACLKKAPKQTVCSLLTSDMLDVASNSTLKTSCTISGISVADTRK